MTDNEGFPTIDDRIDRVNASIEEHVRRFLDEQPEEPIANGVMQAIVDAMRVCVAEQSWLVAEALRLLAAAVIADATFEYVAAVLESDAYRRGILAEAERVEDDGEGRSHG